MDKKARDAAEVLQLKVTLNGSSPRIWRRILVPATYSFFDLHIAIQDALGWTDSHLHAFRIAQKGTARSISIEYPNPDNFDLFDDDALDERKEKIADYFGKSIKQCIYDYDFGDSWSHTVLFESTKPAFSGSSYPQCIGGANACPPEDCGGLGGYDHLQKVMRNPKHKEHREMLEWLNLDFAEDFNPAEFNVGDVVFEDPKARLKEYKRGFGV